MTRSGVFSRTSCGRFSSAATARLRSRSTRSACKSDAYLAPNRHPKHLNDEVDESHGSPVEPVIYPVAIRPSFAIDPRSAVYIDDVEVYVAAARSFSIHAIHFKTPATLREELVELAFSASSWSGSVYGSGICGTCGFYSDSGPQNRKPYSRGENCK
jgi:hypothetical protein